MNITRESVEREQTAAMWGQEYKITPRLVETPIGDGKKIIGFCPLDTRPNYYVIRVPSTWVLDNWSRFGESLVEHTDAIYEAIEDEYGSALCDSCGGLYGDENGGCCEGELERPFPALNDESGVSTWWKILPTELEVKI